MKKILCIFLAGLCLMSTSLTAVAMNEVQKSENTLLEAVVPNTHKLTVITDGNGYVNLDGVKANTDNEVARLSTHVLSFVGNKNYVFNTLIINGKDMTSAVKNSEYTLSNIYEDIKVEVTFKSKSDSSSKSSSDNSNDNSSSKSPTKDNNTKSPDTGMLGGIITPFMLISAAILVYKKKKDD